MIRILSVRQKPISILHYSTRHSNWFLFFFIVVGSEFFWSINPSFNVPNCSFIFYIRIRIVISFLPSVFSKPHNTVLHIPTHLLFYNRTCTMWIFNWNCFTKKSFLNHSYIFCFYSLIQNKRIIDKSTQMYTSPVWNSSIGRQSGRTATVWLQCNNLDHYLWVKRRRYVAQHGRRVLAAT